MLQLLICRACQEFTYSVNPLIIVEGKLTSCRDIKAIISSRDRETFVHTITNIFASLTIGKLPR